MSRARHLSLVVDGQPRAWPAPAPSASRIPAFEDTSAMWPSPDHTGAVHLHPGGRWSSPIGSAQLAVGEKVVIDEAWPLIATWTGARWRYVDAV